MNNSTYFKDWISGWEWGIRIGLFVILLSALVQFGLFAMTQNYMVSLPGAQPEDISFALLLTYVGILSILPVQFRFLRFFQTRSYLAINIMAGLMISILSFQCTDITLFLILRYFQGIVVGNIAAAILTLVFSRLKTEHMQAVGSSVFYGTILSNTIIAGLVASVVVTSYDWKITYYYLMMLQLLSLLIVVLILKPVTGLKKYPLWQVDWRSFIVFSAGAASLTYTIIYGPKYYWFSDSRIQIAAVAAVAGILAFMYRQSAVKRPLINPDVFKSINFMTGLVLLAFYYGMKDSISLIYNYTGNTLKWSTAALMQLALVNLAGLVCFLVISAQLMIKKRHSARSFLLSGFSIMLIFHLWMYNLFTPDLSFADLVIPVFLQGAASGLLFVPLMIFVLSSAPVHTGTSGLVVAAYARCLATLNSIAGFYTMQLYFNKYFKTSFLNYLTPESQLTSEKLIGYRQLFQSKGYSASLAQLLANSFLDQSVNQQTQLLTNKAVFMVFTIILGLILVLLVAVPSINKTCLHWSKAMFTWPRN
ncbi:MFS transporter [Dyadobacter frigoris]|uniref:MFS transporter n=1 Tax=Dyadobacter frigoris TaxID=2576211 RepID=A0A4U6D8R4_9BACT|nr:MFS transporter [Dyadobacter frigoris]TKT92498.1 MFS transporter [Dyadobacter frigoris]GLU55292.1 MFS transporter [Dyadobacter frigoris]